MFINASLVASALAVKEKETGTIEQLLMTPAQTGEMLLAKTSPVFVLMMVVLFVSLVVGMLVFGLPVRGAVWLFALAGALAALAGIGIGVMIATVSKSQQQAQLLTFFVNPPLTLLSGATSPLENMPEFFQKLSYFDPLRYMVTIVRGVTLKDAPWSGAVAEPGCARRRSRSSCSPSAPGDSGSSSVKEWRGHEFFGGQPVNFDG